MADLAKESRLEYEELVPRFREFVREAVPEGATVLVVSKGDRRLVDLGSSDGWHFPQGPDGVYAGAYPPDSDGAIAHLERLKDRGAEFLAFPAVANWWLEHYEAFGEHLRRRCRLVVADDTLGTVYELKPGPRAAGQASRKLRDPGLTGPPADLVPLRPFRSRARRPRPQRVAETTHELRDLGGMFASKRTASGGGKPIRVCLVDTLLQTGGAEWFATQVALMANPGVFEIVAVTWRSGDSALADRLRGGGIEVMDATSWSTGGGVPFDEWKEEGLFDQLERLSPDIVFFSSQYLFEQLSAKRLAPFAPVVRISNFHAEELERTDFSAAARIICATDEQLAAVSELQDDKALLIRTGVDTDLFKPLPVAEKETLKRGQGFEGKTVVLFVARLGDPLKRTPAFQEVVRAVQAERSDIVFLVAGYFESHNNEAEKAFGEFVVEHGVVWNEHVPPWEMPALYQTADFLVSTSATHEGLSNTVLQALASGVVPVVTASGGMHELVEPGESGYLVEDADPATVARELLKAVELDQAARARLVDDGRRRVQERFNLVNSAADYQRAMLSLHRSRAARLCITDGYFTTGGAEWLAAQLMVNANPAELHFELVLHRAETPLVRWLEERGFRTHEATPGTSYSEWLSHGMQHALRRVRPDVVMPCTITTWPHHDPFYRLLIISQNASDAAVLTPEQYDQADYFLCVSADVKAQLSAQHQGKMTVLHNSIDTEMFRANPAKRAAVRVRLGIDPGARVVLWCGRMHEARKRLDVLMDTAASLDGDASVHFLVVGWFRGDEGDQEGWREFMVTHPNLSWVEDVPPWKAQDYYAAADVYLSTSGFKRSDFEGLSVATVQALATELPVVTTMSGGQHEVIEHAVNGRLVEPGDSGALADAIREVVAMPSNELNAMRQRNRRKAVESFDIKRHVRLYTGIARVLRNTVGAALAADPGLPAPPLQFLDVARATERQIRTAASFLTYTWAILPEAVEAPDAPHVLPLAGEFTPVELEAAATRLAPGEWLVIRDLGPEFEASAPDKYHAGSICAVLDYLQLAFPYWSRCERRGRDLVMQKR